MKTLIGVAMWAGGTIVMTGLALILVRQVPLLRDWAGLVPPRRDLGTWASRMLQGSVGAAPDIEDAA